MYNKIGYITSTLFKTAYYNVFSTFDMFKVSILTNDVFKISSKGITRMVETKIDNNSNNAR